MKFLWYRFTTIREYLRYKRKNSSITEHDLGSDQYKNLYKINQCFSSNPWGLQHDITGHVPHHFNIVTRTTYSYKNITSSFEDVCINAATKLANSTDRPIALLWSGGIDSTSALVSLLSVVNSDRITVVCNNASIKEYPSFYNDIIKNKIKTISVQEWALSKQKYFTISGDGGDTVWAVIDDSAWATNSTVFNQPWKTILDKNIAPDFEFIDEFASWSGVQINTWLELRAWYYICCKWQDKCTRLYTLRSDLTEQDACSFYDVDNTFQLWTMNNLDSIIGNSWQEYKMPAKKMIYKFHNDDDYLKNKSKVDSKGLNPKLNNLEILKETPTRFVLFEDYSSYTLPCWPFLDMYEIEKFNYEHRLIPLEVLEK